MNRAPALQIYHIISESYDQIHPHWNGREALVKPAVPRRDRILRIRVARPIPNSCELRGSARPAREDAANHRPRKCGTRFSTNAFIPSTRSSVANNE